MRSTYFQTINAARDANGVLVGDERLAERVEHARHAKRRLRPADGERHGRQRQVREARWRAGPSARRRASIVMNPVTPAAESR